MQEGNWRTLGKPTEASLDWKPNALKCQDQDFKEEYEYLQIFITSCKM